MSEPVRDRIHQVIPPVATDPAGRSGGDAAGKKTLVLLGVNHHTAPMDVRERLAIPESRLAEATRMLLQQPGVREAMILSTCNRVELFTLQDEPREQTNEQPALTRFLGEFFGLPPHALDPHLYEYRQAEAVRHLFRVASSLDSMVVGEPQILGQVKQAWTAAREIGAVSTTLDPLLQRAFTVAKRVRSETQIGSSSVSVASVAVDLARNIFGSLEGKTILLVGAGKMSDLAARHLIQNGATTLLVANRTLERAEKVAATLLHQNSGNTALTTGVVPFEQMHEQAHRADIVVTSTGAPGHLFTVAHGKQMLGRRRNRPMFFIDIAFPRDVEPALNQVEGCFVYDIDDLQQVAAAALSNRTREAEAAESIVANEVEKYEQRLAALDAVPAIKALQQQADAARQAELARAETRLAAAGQPLTPEQREQVEAMTRSLTAKLLHPQLAALRGDAPNRDVPNRDAPNTRDR
jgi:glutamyl-tRNA reductase